MRARQVLAPLAALLLAVVAASCFSDLDPPRGCPSPAQHPGGNCLPGLVSAAAGCLPQDAVECLTGPRKSCTCFSDECPAESDACYPSGDCPPPVTTGHPDAKCSRLSPQDLGYGLPSEYECLCGCAGCGAVCDGVGPVLGVVATNDSAYLPIEIDHYLPDRGTLGIYMRLRGLTNAVVVVCAGDPGVDCMPLAQYYLVTPLTTDFVDQLLFDDPFLGQSAYSWDTPEGKPRYLIFYTQGTPADPVPSLFEIDCVVPFVVPH